jgi:hypothetical protein
MEGWFDRFLCCCVNTSSGEHVSNHGELFGAASASPEAAFPLDSSTPHFLMAQDPHKLAKGFGSARGDDLREAGGTLNTARSTASQNSAMSVEEKEREKTRLQRLVKDFAKEAVTGIAVSLINPETVGRSPHFFQMDRYLTVFSLKPKDGSTAESCVQDFNVKDLTHIYKGAEVSLKAPSLGPAAALCVGLDTNRADRRLFFHFDEPIERDKFYTCLKILRMSVDISRSGA